MLMATQPANLTSQLHHVELGSPEPERLAAEYGRLFGMTERPYLQSWICSGPQRRLVFSKGGRKTLVSAGYAADESTVQRLRTIAAAHAAPASDAAAPFYSDCFALRDPDGNLLHFGTPAPEPTATADAPPARLQHLVLGSRDPDRLKKFYVEVLGMQVSDEVKDETGLLRACFMRSNEEHHSLAVFHTRAGLDHHSYELPDWNAMRDWADRLASEGVFLDWGPGRHGPGNNLFIFFHDLDGNWIELSTELERVEPGRPVGSWPHEERTVNSWGSGFLRS
jgi:catechol 2,3-dioxygenase-like lactoylglutathione lyase family enzyme